MTVSARSRVAAILNRPGVLPILLFLGSTGLYAATMIRTPGWVDDTLKLALAESGQVSSWVVNHNLFTILGHLWLGALAFLDPHAALTILCGLFAGASVLFAYHAGRELTGSPAAAALAAVALAISHSLWWHATSVEVQSLNAAIITLTLFLIARFFRARCFLCLYAAFFLFGIGVFNHALMALSAPAYGTLFVLLLAGRQRIGWRRGLLIVFATALGCLPYLFVLASDVLSRIQGRGLVEAIVSTFDRASGSFFRQSMFPRNLSGSERLFWRLNYVLLLWYNFPAAALPLAVWGTVRLGKPETPRSFAVFFWMALAAQVVWSFNYLIWDMFRFALPVYVLASLPLAVGIDALMRRARRTVKVAALISLLLPAVLYPVVPAVPALADLGRRWFDLYRPVAPSRLEGEYAAASSQHGGWKDLTAGIWDPVRYLMDPVRSNYREVQDFCQGVFARLPFGAHYWDDEAKGGNPLRYYYQGVRRERPDVTVHLAYVVGIDEATEVMEARLMQTALADRGEIFISSLEWPERELVIQLSKLMGDGGEAETLRRMPAQTFLQAVPGLRVVAVPLGTRPGLAIYRISRR